MKLLFHYKDENKKIELHVQETQTVKDIKNVLQNHFGIETKSTETEDKKIVLEYNGSEFNDNWYLTDFGLPVSATLRCYTKIEKHPDFYIFLKCLKETLNLYNTEIDPDEFTVLELRVLLQNKIGFPLSIFRLKTWSNKDMFDDKTLSYYDINKRSLIILETWQGWDSLLSIAMKGYSKQFLTCLSSDEYLKQYQMKAGLFVACFHGNFELVKLLMTLGARVDRHVGEHPCRQWCQPDKKDIDSIDRTNRIEYLKLEYLRCPIHAAILNGQLKVLNLIASTHIHALETKDGYGLPPWRLALHNNHKDLTKNLEQKEVAHFLLGKRFGGKVPIADGYSCSISLFAKLKNWAERAKERVFFYHGFSKSSLKRKTFYKGGLLGYKCLIDGYNNNFKDYVNSYDRLRKKYKFYYFLDQDEKDRHGYPDLYFKTIGLIKPKKTIQFSKDKKVRIRPDRPVPKTFQKWKNAFNQIIFRKTVLSYAPILIKLGVEIDFEELSLGDEPAKKEEEDKKLKTVVKLPPIKGQLKLSRRKVSIASEGKILFNTKKEIDIMKEFEKLRNGVSSTENAQLLLNETNDFKTRSWVRQVNIASKLAVTNAKRLIKKYSSSLELNRSFNF